jgi:putative transposase
VIAAEGLPAQLATRVLGVSESGYYEWRGRAPSARAVRHAWLTEQIQAVHLASRGTYGSRRVHAELTLGLGITVGHGSVEMLMRRAAIKGLPGSRRSRLALASRARVVAECRRLCGESRSQVPMPAAGARRRTSSCR